MTTDALWDDRWLQLAVHIGRWSKDRSRQVGCVIVGSANQILSAGYNGFARGVDDTSDERHARPAKYDWTEHAERNAIYNAARTGIALEGATMYLPWFPCAACARAIVQVGLEMLVAVRPTAEDTQWDEQFEISELLLQEGGVKVRLVASEHVLT
jgi:dCMP deaminase